MGTKKRKNGGKSGSEKADDASNGAGGDRKPKLKVRGPIPVKKHRVSPTMLVSMMLLLLGVASGVYIINFTDIEPMVVVTEVIETAHLKVLELIDTFSAEQTPPLMADDHQPAEPDTPPNPEDEDSVVESLQEPQRREEREVVREEPVGREAEKAKEEAREVREEPKEAKKEPEKAKEEATEVREEKKEVKEEQIIEPEVEVLVEPVEEKPKKEEKQEPVKQEKPKEEPVKEERIKKEEAKKDEPAKELPKEERKKESVKDEPAAKEAQKEEKKKAPEVEKPAEQKKEEPPKKEPEEEPAKPEAVKEKKDPKLQYAKADVTNDADFVIRMDLDEADSWMEANKPADALPLFEKLLRKYPASPRALYGRAHSLDLRSELERSNPLLEQAIAAYLKLLEVKDVPKALMLKAGRRVAERQVFRGWSDRAAKAIKWLIELYPEDLELWNELGVKYLMAGRNSDAEQAFRQVLRTNPDDGVALTHVGFVLKTSGKHLEAIPYLQKGIDSKAPGTQDGRFFFHLGDALNRAGNQSQAYAVYEEGVKLGLFMSKYQRSLYNVESLTGRPWWTPEQTKHQKELKVLEEKWETIREEGLAQLDPKTGSFLPEEENLRETGDWKQFTLFQRGRKNEENCRKVPKTCALIEQFPDAAGCRRGQVKFSVMQPGVHVWPHCGPTNCRIRAHLGLVVPPGPRIRVADDTRTWQEGKFIIFDDSFEHEVWHDGESVRLVLIVDIWHPDLTTREKMSLSAI